MLTMYLHVGYDNYSPIVWLTQVTFTLGCNFCPPFLYTTSNCVYAHICNYSVFSSVPLQQSSPLCLDWLVDVGRESIDEVTTSAQTTPTLSALIPVWGEPCYLIITYSLKGGYLPSPLSLYETLVCTKYGVLHLLILVRVRFLSTGNFSLCLFVKF